MFMAPIRVLYYARVNRDYPYHSGIIQKCRGQAAAFRQLGARVDTILLSNQGVHLNEELLAAFPLRRRLVSYFFYFFRLDRMLARQTDFSKIDVFYMRFPLCSPSLLYLLRMARKQNPQLRIVLEFPTFPYGEEFRRKGWFFRLAYCMDRMLRARLKKYVGFAVHYGAETSILGIPAINLRNGIGLEEKPVFPDRLPGEEVSLIAVGNWNYWHGLDRFLRGLAEYYAQRPDRKITLVIIGDGQELPNLKRLAESLSLNGVVQFVSHLPYRCLKPYLLKADVGIGTLGLHRKNVAVDSSIKHREYCANGLPFILSASDPDFPSNFPFVHYIPEGDSAVEIEEVIQFLDDLRRNTPYYRQQIRAYAEERLSWNSRMQLVLNRISR